MKCQNCDSPSTRSRDIILKNGDNITSRYDHLCDSCTELAVEARDEQFKGMINKLKSPEWRIQKDLKFLEKAREKEDTASEIRYMSRIGVSEARLGNFDKAIEWVSDAIELNRDLNSYKQSLMLIQLAKIQERAGEYEAADKSFKEGFSLERKNREQATPAGQGTMIFSTELRNYGRVLIKQKRWEEAEEVFKESIEVWEFVVGHDNSLSGLLLIHGKILGHLNREEEQTESYTKAVEQLNQENKEIPQWLIDHLS